jgi:hypothetical protein
MLIGGIHIGEEYLNTDTKQLSRVTNKTSNSVELFNRAVANKKRKRDMEGELIKGFDCKQWYTIEEFNKKFQKVDVIAHKFEKLQKWISECIDKGKWTKLVH